MNQDLDKFSDYYQAEVTIKFIKPCLGARFDESERIYKFERDNEGNLQFSAMYWHAMFRNVLRASPSFKDLPPELPKNILPDLMRINAPCTALIEMTREQAHEALGEGSKLYARFLVPGSVLPLERFRQLVSEAGQWVGFSPARSTMGYGRFLVEDVKKIS